MNGTILSWPAIVRPGAVLLVCLIVAGLYGATQERIWYSSGQPYDAANYVEMAGQVARHEPMSADKPFIFRVALPWLVGTLFPHDLLGGFRTLNVATGVLTLGVLSIFLTRFATGTAVAIVLFLFVANPNGPLRFSHFYPGLTDAPALLCILLIFFVHQQWPRSSLGKIATVSVLTLVGVTFREITVTAPVALWGGAALAAGIRGDGVWPRLRALLSPWLVPIAAGVAGIVITHVSVTANGDYAL